MHVEIICSADFASADSSQDQCCFLLELEFGCRWKFDDENILQLAVEVLSLVTWLDTPPSRVNIDKQNILDNINLRYYNGEEKSRTRT
jgi:hypothetical protein